jgi:hypothetical protein
VGLAFVLFFSGFGFVRAAVRSPTCRAEAQGSRFARRLAEFLLIFWAFTLPEFDTLMHRLLHEGGLWDWRLLGAASLMAGNAIVAGLRRISTITDGELYASIAGTAPELATDPRSNAP